MEPPKWDIYTAWYHLNVNWINVKNKSSIVKIHSLNFAQRRKQSNTEAQSSFTKHLKLKQTKNEMPSIAQSETPTRQTKTSSSTYSYPPQQQSQTPQTTMSNYKTQECYPKTRSHLLWSTFTHTLIHRIALLYYTRQSCQKSEKDFECRKITQNTNLSIEIELTRTNAATQVL